MIHKQNIRVIIYCTIGQKAITHHLKYMYDLLRYLFKDDWLRDGFVCDITFLVDTHSVTSVEKLWKSEWGFEAFFSSFKSNSRGVAILFKNTFGYELLTQKCDKGGNFVILSIMLKSNDKRLILAAVYGPNESNSRFYDELSRQLATFDDSSLVLGGDWNVPQDYIVDTKKYSGRHNKQNHQCIKNITGHLDLTDISRDQHQDLSQFTWHGPNKTQARLDYFFSF